MRLQTVLVFCAVFGLSYGMLADLYLNKDKFGEYFKLEISEKGCTNVPLNWENQAVSVDTHGSCLKFYDLPYCRGKYVALQPYHGTFQDNLDTLGFSKIISSASPCGPKVPTGRYYIQNGADGSVLTIETRNNTPVARTYLFKPYISKGQQFQIEKVALADYELIPRIHQKMNPITYDMSISTAAHPVRRTWKIESVYRGRYLIKNEWSNRCLYKAENGKVEEHECVAWSPNQEWIFRSIKVKPYFPSKEELKKKPIRPDSDFPFEPLDDAFSSVPYKPNTNRAPAFPPAKSQTGKKPGQNGIQVQRPGPLVINPGEPFPPVFPFPIRPSLVNHVNKKQPNGKPPVPHVRHPGPLPFPVEPLVTDPKKPEFSPFDTYNVFGNNTQKTKPQKDVDEEGDENDEDPDEKKSEEQSQEDLEQESGEKDEVGDEDASEEQEDQQGGNGPDSSERDETAYGHQKGSDERDENFDDKGSYEREDEESADDNGSDEADDAQDKHEKKRKQEAAAGINYSDYRLYF